MTTEEPESHNDAGDAAEASSTPRRLPGYSTEELATHSVFNELNIFPGRPDEVIQIDWRCSACGYNLRGLMTGERCPECGHVELYRPPPSGEVSYATWYEERKRQTSDLKALGVLLLLFLAGGPLAIVGAFFSQSAWGVMAPVVIGPAVEEMLKIGLILVIVETRPYLIRRENDIILAAIASSLGFAVLENFLYLHVYVSSPSIGLEMWRWSICTLLHVTCSIIACQGVIAVWRGVDEQKSAPLMRLMYRPVLIAIVVHAGYNATVMLAAFSGFEF